MPDTLPIQASPHTDYDLPLSITVNMALSQRINSKNKIFTDDSCNQIIQRMQRNAKKAIIDQGALAPLPQQGRLPTVPAVIESAMYLGKKEHKEIFRGMAAESYTHPILRPLMELMALAALGKHDISRPGKKFKIIGAYGPTIESLKSDDKSCGVYSLKNSVFAGIAGRGSPNNMWGGILHESAHFAMQEVFKNHTNPYRSNDKKAQQCFEGIIKSTSASEYFRLIQKDYSSEHHAAEFIARVPQIIASFENGHALLKKRTPALLDYYENTVNPAINRYLQEHQAEKYMMLPAKSKGTMPIMPSQGMDYVTRHSSREKGTELRSML